MGWSDQNIIAQIIVIEGTGDGLFIYNGTGAPGNPPILAAVAPGVTQDPFGNSVQAVMNIGTFTAAHIGWDINGNTYVSDTNGTTRVVVTGGAGGIWSGAPDPAIIFYNAFGATLMVVDPQRGGMFQYLDNNSAVQGGLIGAFVGKTTTDPILGNTVQAGVNIINPVFGDTTVVVGSHVFLNNLNWNTPAELLAAGGNPSGAVGPAALLFSPGVTAGPDFANLGLFGESPDTTIDAGMVLAKGASQAQPVKNTSELLEVQGNAVASKIIAFTPGSTSAEEPWHALSLAAGWSTVGGQPVPSYRLLPDGNIQLTGVATHTGFSATTGLSTAGALPAAYRPTTLQIVGGNGNGETPAEVTTAGTVNAFIAGTLTATVCRFNGTYPVNL